MRSDWAADADFGARGAGRGGMAMASLRLARAVCSRGHGLNARLVPIGRSSFCHDATRQILNAGGRSSSGCAGPRSAPVSEHSGCVGAAGG